MDVPPLAFVGVALPQTDEVYNLRVFLDSQVLLDEQMTAVATRAFPQLCVVYQLHLDLDQEALLPVTSCLDYCNVLYIRLLQLVEWAVIQLT